MRIPTPLEHNPTAKELIGSFYQHGTGNCAAIAPIKAALMAFGTRGVLADAFMRDGRAVVVMRDSDREYEITEQELARARELSHFEPRNSVIDEHAYFLFAAMAKRAQHEDNDGTGADSFEAAVRTLNDGEHWTKGPYWLGLDQYKVVHYDKRVPWRAKRIIQRHLREHAACQVKTAAHVWFASGSEHDWYGRNLSWPKLFRTKYPPSGVLSIEAPPE